MPWSLTRNAAARCVPVLCVVAIATVANTLLAAPAPNLTALVKQGARVSAFAVNLRTGETLLDLNASDRLTPASVTKTVLAAHALERFGSESTFKSRLFRRGALVGDQLKGDLVFVGAGDPSLTNEKLWFLTTDVARVGIREITGDIVLNTALFGLERADANRLAGQHASTHAYDSPLSAAAVNFSVLAVVASPGKAPGIPGRVALEPYDLENVRLTGRVNTGSGNRLAASRVDKGSYDAVVASGTVASSAFPQRVYRSVSDADAYTAATLRAFLAAAGVRVRGKWKVERASPVLSGAGALAPVAEVEGFPLDWQLRGLFKMSNNFIADMLTIQLDLAEHAKKSGGTLSGGADALQDYARAALLESRFKGGANPSGLLIESGSGLTPANRMSARDVVAILDRMNANAREFPSFLAALPIAGSEGTVKRRFDTDDTRHLRDTVRAKTGTLTEPIDAVGLAGYSRTKSGDWVAFCTLVNGSSRVPTLGVDRIRDAIDADLAVLLPPEN